MRDLFPEPDVAMAHPSLRFHPHLDGDRLIHPCALCGGVAPFGYGVVDYAKGQLGLWGCGAHRAAVAGMVR